jgi:CheY-like chemotaxis protein
VSCWDVPTEKPFLRASTVLVIDDDPDVRELAAGLLRETGHTVLEASTGQEAIVLFEAHPEIDLIFTDIVMPGIDGFRVADVAKTRRPEVKILYTTGFAGRAAEYLGVKHGEILLKPYRGHQLAAAVHNALG